MFGNCRMRFGRDRLLTGVAKSQSALATSEPAVKFILAATPTFDLPSTTDPALLIEISSCTGCEDIYSGEYF